MIECTECFAYFAGDTAICPDCSAALPATDDITTADVAVTPLEWLEPTDGAEVVTEARTAVVKSFVKAASRKTATIQLVITDSAPPLEPGERPRLKLEPCDCEPGCRRERVVGYRLCHPCRVTLSPEQYAEHKLYRTHLKAIGDPNWETAADGHPASKWRADPTPRADHGPCPRCSTGRQIQFANVIDSVCAPADPDARCPKCGDSVAQCITTPSFSARCGWKTWSPCGLWVAGPSRTKSERPVWDRPLTTGVTT